MSLCVLPACKSVRVTEPLEPKSETTLVVTRAGNQATLSWKAEKDTLYTVMYSDQIGGKGQWNILPGSMQLKGAAGQTLSVSDRLGSDVKRYYRLHVEKAGVK